ncbi:MAG: glycosyltransferase 61 family protein [Pseudomonadota bacterium]
MTQLGELAVGTFSNVALTSRRKSLGNRFVGGLADPDAFPDYARYSKDGVVCDTAPPEFAKEPRHLAGRYVYGGFLMKHFGHLITECVHRLWVSSLSEFRDLPVVFMARRKDIVDETLLRGLREHFRCGEIIVLDEDTLVETLVIGESGKQLKRPCAPAYQRWLTDHIRLQEYTDPQLPEKICILRGHLPHGKLIGEREIESWLHAEGYHSLRPENLSLSRQLAHLCSAKKIVFTEGSAVHLLDLLPPISASVAVIRRRPATVTAQTSLQSKVDKPCIYYRVAQALFFNATGDIRFSKALSYVNLPDVAQFLVKNNFLESDPEIALLERPIYSTDLSEYFAEVLEPDRDPTDLEEPANAAEPAIEHLLDSHLKQFEEKVELQYELFLTRAYLAMAEGRYDAAVQHAEDALRLYPHSEQVQSVLRRATWKRNKVATTLGSFFDRCERAFRALSSAYAVRNLSPPTAFFERQI